MAELVNLRDADKYIETCRAMTEKWKRDLEDPNKGIWSDAQRAELAEVRAMIVLVRNALVEVMHNNRDGRGTAPAKPKPNSMLDRTR